MQATWSYQARGLPVPTGPGVQILACVRLVDWAVDYVIVDRTTELRASLVARASAQLHLGVPDVHTAPPRGGLQLVGVPVWFWSDHPAPRTATAAVPGLSASVTATPGPLVVTTTAPDGRPTTRRCDDGGVAWDPTRPGSEQHTACAATFQVDGRVQVQATVTWTLRWRSSDGRSGTLPAIARTTGFALVVHQAQAVTD